MKESTIFLMYGLLFAFYIPFIFYYKRRQGVKFGRRSFFSGVISVLQNCSNDDECVGQVQLLYKRLAERYSNLSDNLRSAIESMEDFICAIDTSTDENFRDTFSIDKPTDLRSRIVSVYQIMKARQPFSSVSSKEGNLLTVLMQAVDTQNIDLGRSTLRQLADEIEVLEGSLRTQNKRNQLSFVISIIGVILTIFFGVISFIQFFATTPITFPKL